MVLGAACSTWCACALFPVRDLTLKGNVVKPFQRRLAVVALLGVEVRWKRERETKSDTAERRGRREEEMDSRDRIV